MRRKALIISTLGRQFFLFEAANIRALECLGFEVHGAANLADEDSSRLSVVGIQLHHIELHRSPWSPRNLYGIVQLIQLIRKEKFQLIHAHSPVGGVAGRLAAFVTKTKPCLYTAHGFHFYQGAPVFNWLAYFGVEYLLARITDTIITINDEDYRRASRLLPAKGVYRIMGVGVDTQRIRGARFQRADKRRELGLAEESVVFLSIGELNPGKNHQLTLRAFAMSRQQGARLLICGRGKELDALQSLAKQLGVGERVSFLGYRADVPEICVASDVYISASQREGLPLSGVEAMAAGLPSLCSKVRGNIDLIDDDVNGCLFDQGDVNQLVKLMDTLAEDVELRSAMGRAAQEKARHFDVSNAEAAMREVYSRSLTRHQDVTQVRR